MTNLRGLPTLSAWQLDNVFAQDRVAGPVRISSSDPLKGRLLVGSNGVASLSPQEDLCGGDMAMIVVHGLSMAEKTRFNGRAVLASGVFEPQKGLTIDRIVIDRQTPGNETR